MRALVAVALALCIAPAIAADGAADAAPAAAAAVAATGSDAEPPLPHGATRIELVNPGFEMPPVRDVHPGWTLSIHSSANAYLFARDEQVFHSGKASMRITRNGKEPWGMVSQDIKAAGLAGHTVLFSAWLRTDKATGDGALVLVRTFAMGAVDKVAALDPQVRGTQDWKRYEVRLPITARDTNIDIGALLHGDGTLWVDDASLIVLP